MFIIFFITQIFRIIFNKEFDRDYSENKPFTLYSLVHFIAHIPIAILFYIILGNKELAVVYGGFGTAIIWEILEFLLIPYFRNFASETNFNRLFDIIIGTLGSCLIYLF